MIIPGQEGSVAPPAGFTRTGFCKSGVPPTHQGGYAIALSGLMQYYANACFGGQGAQPWQDPIGTTIPANTKHFTLANVYPIQPSGERARIIEYWENPTPLSVPMPYVVTPGLPAYVWPPQPEPLAVPTPVPRTHPRPSPRSRPRPVPRLKPAPRYNPKNWPRHFARPDLKPRLARPLPRYKDEPSIDIQPNGLTKSGSNTGSRPPKGVKEKKINKLSGMGRVFSAIINGGSESAEFLDILFSAAGVEGGTLLQRGKRFFDEKAYDNLDWEELIAGLALNYVEDQLIGRLAGAASKSMKQDLGQSTTTMPTGGVSPIQ